MKVKEDERGRERDEEQEEREEVAIVSDGAQRRECRSSIQKCMSVC